MLMSAYRTMEGVNKTASTPRVHTSVAAHRPASRSTLLTNTHATVCMLKNVLKGSMPININFSEIGQCIYTGIYSQNIFNLIKSVLMQGHLNLK